MSTALLQSISYEGVSIRMVGTLERPEWIARDVCEVLGLSNVSEALSSFEPDEAGDVISADVTGRAQNMRTVTEPGLYRLIFASRKPDAVRFRRWVFHEVLPQIRRTGSYSVAPQVSRAEFDALAATVARLEKQASFGPHFGAEARLARLEAKVEQLPLFLESPAKPNVRPQIRSREAERNAAREERLQRLVKVWGEEFGQQFTPLYEARRRSQRIADLVAELGDEVRHLLREANTRGLVEGQHDNHRNTKAWRPVGAAERN